MKTYVDANVLVRIYLQLPGSAEALALLTSKEIHGSNPIPITDLLRMEVTNAFQRMVFESRTNGQWRVPAETAAMALGNFSEELILASWLCPSPLTLAEIDAEFTSLVARYTAKHGFRTYDMIHVASALKLRCKRFLSFDAKANALAKLVGLKTW
jgi:predicted nucleic acid-binding protein